MDDHGSVFERRTARLLRRAAFLRQRIADRGGGDRTAWDVAEVVAIEWAVDLLVRQRELLQEVRDADCGDLGGRLAGLLDDALGPAPARSPRPPPPGAP
jgi:hypothetical protein